MDNRSNIFILSDNRDFIESLSSIVTRELQLSCKIVVEESAVVNKDVVALITDRILMKEYEFPIIPVNLPLRVNKLLASIEQLINKDSNTDIIDIGSSLQLSLQHKILTHILSGETVSLTDKESQLLQIIVASGETGISRESLMKDVWKIDSALDTHTLETHIYRLRRKIKEAFDIEMIKAFEGGYRL